MKLMHGYHHSAVCREGARGGGSWSQGKSNWSRGEVEADKEPPLLPWINSFCMRTDDFLYFYVFLKVFSHKASHFFTQVSPCNSNVHLAGKTCNSSSLNSPNNSFFYREWRPNILCILHNFRDTEIVEIIFKYNIRLWTKPGTISCRQGMHAAFQVKSNLRYLEFNLLTLLHPIQDIFLDNSKNWIQVAILLLTLLG